jgi:hypothetical protein
LAVAVLSLLLLIPALGGGWQLDDWFHRSRILGHGDAHPLQVFVPYDGRPEHNRAQMEAGTLPWWASPDLHLAFFRYASTLSMLLDYELWPDHPALMHLHSLLWLAAAVFAAALLYRRVLGPTWVAGLAALLYAVDDAHAIPASYLANRNALIAACFGFLSVLLYARWRERGGRWGPWASAALLALALAAGEMGVATVGYLAAYALALDRGRLRERVLRLWPHGLVVAAWVLVYRFGGFGSHGSGFYLDPLHDPVGFVAGFARRAALLLMGQWTPVPAELGLVFAPGSRAAQELGLFSLVVVVALAALLIPLFVRSRTARFWGLGVLFSLVPIAAVGPENRLLGFVGLGAMALLAELVQAAFGERPAGATRIRWRVLARGAVVVLLPLHLLAAPLLGIERVELQDDASSRMLRAIASVPSDSGIRKQELVLVNPPDHIYLVTAIPVVRELEGLPNPRWIRALSTGSALEITRSGSRALRVRFPQGFFLNRFSRYVRSRGDRFRAGERIELPGLTVEVESLGAQGAPEQVRYTFPLRLEDPSLRWMIWRDGTYMPWSPPAIGATVKLQPVQGIF